MGDGGCLVVLLIFFGFGVNMLTWEFLLDLHCALSETDTIAETADGYDSSRAAQI